MRTTIILTLAAITSGCGPPEAEILVQSRESLHAIWGSSENDIWIGSEGTDRFDEVGGFFHFDGASWAHQNGVSGMGQHPAWGSGPNDIWAWSQVWGHPMRLQILHYDGSEWSLSHEVVYSGTSLGGIIEASDAWGTGPDDVWVVGVQDADNIYTAPFIVHYTGGAWVGVAPPPDTEHAHSVWTSEPGDVWLITEDGLFHDTGAGWELVPEAPSATMVRGTSSGDVFVAGTNTVHRWVGDGTFEPLGDTSSADILRRRIYGMWVDSADSIWTVGSQDGDEGTSLSLSCSFLCLEPSISSSTGTPTYGAVSHWDGEEWTTRTLESYPGEDMWSPGTGSAFFMVAATDPETGDFVYSVLEWSLFE
jgi:hypothetical protein